MVYEYVLVPAIIRLHQYPLPLARLHEEIRDMIYAYFPDAIRLLPEERIYACRDAGHEQCHMELLGTCRQIYDEAAFMPFKSHLVILRNIDPGHILVWAKQMPLQASYFCNITWEVSYGFLEQYLSKLYQHAPKLYLTGRLRLRLRVGVYLDWWTHPEPVDISIENVHVSSTFQRLEKFMLYYRAIKNVNRYSEGDPDGIGLRFLELMAAYVQGEKDERDILTLANELFLGELSVCSDPSRRTRFRRYMQITDGHWR